jgi:hypothetical protein
LVCQETFIKTLLPQKQPVIKQGLPVEKKPLLPLAFISVLLLSAVAGTQLAYFASANFFPEEPPPGIRINSDGSIEGTRQIQRIGNLYTLTGNIYNTIVVLRDSIVMVAQAILFRETVAPRVFFFKMEVM